MTGRTTVTQSLLTVLTALTGYCQFLPDASTTITYEADAGVKEPVLIYRKAPVYSEDGRKAKWQKVVRLSLVVGVDGRPDQVSVLEAVGLGLDEQAVEAVSQWRFSPGLKGSRPVPVRAVVEANFRERGADPTRVEYRTSLGVSAPVASLRFGELVGESCGKTTVSLHIGADGLVSDVRVVSATYDSVAGAVAKIAKGWRFKPARQKGVPVEADADVDFECEPWPSQP